MTKVNTRADIANALIDSGINEKISVMEAEAFLSALAPQAGDNAEEPVGYVTAVELTHLRLGAGCVDLFGKVVPKGFEMVPLYSHPSLKDEVKGGDGEEAFIECLSAGKPFVFDPATNFLHADDGGAPDGGIKYVPVDTHPCTSTPVVSALEDKGGEKERLRFEGDLDKWMKIIGAGITGYQPEAYALMDLACYELVKLRAMLSFLNENVALELVWQEVNGDPSECGWHIFRRFGGRSDRDYKVVGTGETVEEAIKHAMEAR